MRSRTTRSTRPALIAVALVAAAFLAAACGSEESGAPTGSGGSPVVVVSAGGRSESLAATGGCVQRAGRVECGDPPAPRCTDSAVPRLPLAGGAALTMEFPERPRRVEASIGSGTPLRAEPSGTTVTWTPDGTPGRPSPLVILADLRAGQLAFTACVVPTG